MAPKNITTFFPEDCATFSFNHKHLRLVLLSVIVGLLARRTYLFCLFAPLPLVILLSSSRALVLSSPAPFLLFVPVVWLFSFSSLPLLPFSLLTPPLLTYPLIAPRSLVLTPCTLPPSPIFFSPCADFPLSLYLPCFLVVVFSVFLQQMFLVRCFISLVSVFLSLFFSVTWALPFEVVLAGRCRSAECPNGYVQPHPNSNCSVEIASTNKKGFSSEKTVAFPRHRLVRARVFCRPGTISLCKFLEMN